MDDLLEGNETFNVTIDESTLPDGVVLADPYEITVTILDSDSKCVL